MMDSAQHKYQTTHNDDRDDRSSTEVEESLIGDEQKWHDIPLGTTRRKTRSNRFMTFMKSLSGPFNTVLLLMIFGLLLRISLNEQPKKPLNPWQIGGDMTGVGQDFSMRITTFQPDESYAPNNTADFFTDEVLDKWNALMPKGMGFVLVEDPDSYHDLPTPIKWPQDPDMTVFTTSATHQLHCLYVMASTYSAMTSGREMAEDHHWHMIHCFDYMRQAIMCSADMALEGLETTFPDHNGGSDGWDAKHVCRDWNQVIEYLENMRPWDNQVIY